MKTSVALLVFAATFSMNSYAKDYQCLLNGYEKSNGTMSAANPNIWGDLSLLEGGAAKFIDGDTKKTYTLKYLKTEKDDDGTRYKYCDLESCRKYGMFFSTLKDPNKPPMVILWTQRIDGLTRYYNCGEKK